MLRRAAVAGRFYPGEVTQLQSMLRQCFPGRHKEALPAKGLIVPHAGYIYSGRVAGETYSAVRLPRRFIILCPNHVGMGAPISILSEGEWETPLGRVKLDSQLAEILKDQTLIVQDNFEAHRDEHALEVHLPFLQFLLGNDFTFLPISVGVRRFDCLKELGRAMAATITRCGDDVLMIASSDMNHFEPADRTEVKDHMAIEPILRLDSEALRQAVEGHDISMCGYGPSVSVIEAAVQLGAERAELIRYTHSGEVTGDNSSVVGYAGLVIY